MSRGFQCTAASPSVELTYLCVAFLLLLFFCRSEPSDASSTAADAAAQAAKRKRPRSGSTSASDDSGHAFSVFTPVFPPELSDDFLAKSIAEETERSLKVSGPGRS
jgi:hypothetical protein